MRYLLLAALTAFSCLAADVDGKWVAKMETPNGSREINMTFKAEGTKLTGTMGSRMGDAPIEEGTIDGDNISFVVTRKFQDQEFKMKYTGKVSGGEIKLESQMGERKMEMVAKRAAS